VEIVGTRQPKWAHENPLYQPKFGGNWGEKRDWKENWGDMVREIGEQCLKQNKTLRQSHGGGEGGEKK